MILKSSTAPRNIAPCATGLDDYCGSSTPHDEVAVNAGVTLRSTSQLEQAEAPDISTLHRRDRQIFHAEPGSAEPEAAFRPPVLPGILPADVLQPGEIIVLMLKPSLWMIPLASAGSVIAMAAITLLVGWLAEVGWHAISRRDVVLLGVGMIGLRLFWQCLDWLSRIYILTDQRVIRVQGVLRLQVFEAPLKKVQETQCYVSLRERLFGLGTIIFSTTSSRVATYWWMVSRPMDVHRTVLDTLRRYR